MDVPVVFLTSRSSAEDEVRGLRLGASDYIRKPADRSDLLLRVEKVLADNTRRELCSIG